MRVTETQDATDAAAVTLPAKANFESLGVTYLDSGKVHPFSIGARRKLQEYVARRTLASGPLFSLSEARNRVMAQFAKLINADPHEICIVQSTTDGEHLVVEALDIPNGGGRIVTDTLHFIGSFYLYNRLADFGVDVAWVKPRDGRSIDMRDMEAAIDKRTKLVALSLVSAYNGFEHDLKRICEIAHARGAYVYADVMQAAGTIPVDVKESGVDFAACACYKWLMGDFGMGFLYVRSSLLERVHRPRFGYFQMDHSQGRPFDPESLTPTLSASDDATGHFATGTTSAACAVQLEYSLDYLDRIGVSAIQAYRKPMTDRLKAELPRLGYRLLTPDDSRTALVACACPDGSRLATRLDSGNVRITVHPDRFRVTPSIFNDMADIDRLLDVLA